MCIFEIQRHIFFSFTKKILYIYTHFDTENSKNIRLVEPNFRETKDLRSKKIAKK